MPNKRRIRETEEDMAKTDDPVRIINFGIMIREYQGLSGDQIIEKGIPLGGGKFLRFRPATAAEEASAKEGDLKTRLMYSFDNRHSSVSKKLPAPLLFVLFGSREQVEAELQKKEPALPAFTCISGDDKKHL